METFVCERCGNSNPKYIGNKKGMPYCRFCITMRGEEVSSFIPSNGLSTLKLDYELSDEQITLSNKIVENYKSHKDTLINAVCGAGKTELIYGVMKYALMNRQTVGFAVPRRDVAIELFERIKSAFPYKKVVSVYGGHTEKLSGDIIVLTTHQLYRYPQFFDLLILDEIDAFPYNGNDLLETMFKRSLRGNCVQMSATPSDKVLDYYRKSNREILELNTRFHKHPIPVPRIIIKFSIFRFISLIQILNKSVKEKKPVFVFVATIEEAENLYKFIKLFIRNGYYVHSKCPDRKETIESFRRGKFSYLITTAVLERGVTIKNLQVIVYNADHSLYNEHTLIQISGRVGRKKDAPTGEVIFIASKETKYMRKARDTIIDKNRYL